MADATAMAAASVEAACNAFLSATAQADRAAAEKMLLDFRSWSSPLATCRHLLLHSSVAYAKLQALFTVRECLGTQWTSLSAADRTELQRLLLQQQTQPDAEHFVKEAAAQVLAVHAKQDLLDAHAPGGHCQALLHGATQMLEDPSGAHADAALRALAALLTEFGAPSAGAVGGSLPWSMHARARTAFEERHLITVFRTAVQHLDRLKQQAAAATSPPSCRSLSLCASLLAGVLSWEFGAIGEAAGADEPRPGLNASVVRPPAGAAGWQELLRTPYLLNAAIELHAAAAAAAQLPIAHAPGGHEGGQGPPSRLVIGLSGGNGLSASGAVGEVREALHALEQLLVMLASVSRRVFEPLGDGAHASYAALLLTTASNLTATRPPTALDQHMVAARCRTADGTPLALPSMGEAAFMSGCVLLQRLVMCAGAEALLHLPAGVLHGLLTLLHGACMLSLKTSLALQGAGEWEELESSAIVDAYDVLMEGWNSLLCGTATFGGQQRPAEIVEAAWQVYEASVRAKLHAATEAASREAEDEVEDGHEDEERERERDIALASLGRARLPAAAGLLLAPLQSCTSQLRAYCELAATGGAAAAAQAGASVHSLASLHEQCDCLVRCIGHLIADEPAHGETLEPPPEAAVLDEGSAAAPDATQGAGSTPVGRLSDAVTELMRLQMTAITSYESSPDASPLSAALSPVLATTLLWFLRRFASTYLMPDEATCTVLFPPFLSQWGADTQGATALLSLCVDASAVYLLRWSSEQDTAAEACELLAALARLRAPRRGPAQMLSNLPAWQSLARCDPSALKGASQRKLLEALCRAAAAIGNDARRDTTLRELIAPLAARLHAVASRCAAGAQPLAGGGLDPHAASGEAALSRGSRYPSLHRPDVMLEVRACCGGLCGAGLSCGRESVIPITEGIGTCLPLLLAMVPTYCPSSEPLLPILKVHRDLAKSGATSLPPHLAQAFVAHVSELMATYARHAPPLEPPPAPPPQASAMLMGGGKVGGGSARSGGGGGGAGNSAAEAEETVRYKQVKTLLQLLLHLASREEGEGDEQAYTAAMVSSLGHLLPCVTPALLEYPKVCAAYFGVLGAYLENRPLAAVSMPPALYGSVLASICHGISHHDINICRGALESAYEFARRAAQHAGRASASDDLIRQLLGRIAADLLTLRLHPDVIDPAAGNALLALIVAQPAHWQALAASVVDAQPTAEKRDRASAVLGGLLSTNGVAANLSRPNRQRFRANLEAMLRAVTAGGLTLPT